MQEHPKATLPSPLSRLPPRFQRVRSHADHTSDQTYAQTCDRLADQPCAHTCTHPYDPSGAAAAEAALKRAPTSFLTFALASIPKKNIFTSKRV